MSYLGGVSPIRKKLIPTKTLSLPTGDAINSSPLLRQDNVPKPSVVKPVLQALIVASLLFLLAVILGLSARWMEQ
jgi:hypothetical protein